MEASFFVELSSNLERNNRAVYSIRCLRSVVDRVVVMLDVDFKSSFGGAVGTMKQLT